MVLGYDIAVDLTPEFNKLISPKFSVSVGDHGSREYTVKVLQDGIPYEIADNSLVSIVGKKPDGHIFAYDCTYSDEYVYFTIEEQMTPVAGIVTCELVIIDTDGHKLGSANFTFWVEPCPVSDGEASESDLQLFQQILDAADDLDDVREILDRAVPIAEQLGDVEKLLTAFPTEEASGSLLTLTDGADGIPAKKVTLNLSPHQSGSGDPSPDNVRPISGYQSVKLYRTGKNMLDPSLCVERTQGGVTRKVNADGTITLTGTPTQTSIFWKSTDDMSIPIKAGAYAVTTFNSKFVLRFVFKKAESPTSSLFTLTEDDEILNVRFVLLASGEELNDVAKPMLVSGESIPTAFTPYQGETYTITIPTEAGTVYGGSLEINDNGSGTLTVDRAINDASEGTFNMLSSTKPHTVLGVSPTFPNIKMPATNNDITNAVSNKYRAAAYLGTNGLYNYTGTDALFAITTTGKVAVYDSTQDFSAMTTDEIGAYLTGTKFCYPLATPQTYTLTAEQVTTLLGDNTLWMDADGTIDLQYRADTQMYIDNRISALNTNLAYIEDGTTASRAYSVGQFVLISGQLYKVTASIASGATFTVGTNVVATTVGTELTALA